MHFVISHGDGWSSPGFIIDSDSIALVLMTSGFGFIFTSRRFQNDSIRQQRIIFYDNKLLFFNTYIITIKNNLYSPWIMIFWNVLEFGRIDGEFRSPFND